MAVLNIEDIIDDFTELGPEEHRIQTYIGKRITITSFQDYKCAIKHKEEDGSVRRTLKVNFVCDGKERHIITSAKYIVRTLEALSAHEHRFNSPNPGERVAVCAVIKADERFGQLSNFRLCPASVEG